MPEEPKRVGLVGHCGFDTSSLTRFVKKTLGHDTVIHAIKSDANIADKACDVLLINRVLEGRFNAMDGLDLIRQLLRASPDMSAMLISNYEDAQESAEQAGARPGFGKRQVGKSIAAERLRDACGIGA